MYWLIIQNVVIDNGRKYSHTFHMKSKHSVQISMYTSHGGQTPSYKLTHAVCNRIHVCIPHDITWEMSAQHFHYIHFQSIKKMSVYCTASTWSTSVVHWVLVTGRPKLPQTQSTSWHRSAQQRVGSYWWIHSSLCSPHSPNKDGEISNKYIWHVNLWISFHLESFLTAPCANAPTTTAAGPSGTKVRGHTASPEEKEVHMRGQPGGRWSDTGFLIILRSFWGPSAALTLSLCNSWTKIEEEKKECLGNQLR